MKAPIRIYQRAPRRLTFGVRASRTPLIGVRAAH
jgi:hypothetical protein